MNTIGDPYFPATRTGWLVVFTISFLVYSVMSLMAGIFLHLLRHKPVKLFDGLVVLALLVGIVQSVMVIKACGHGLGKHENALTDPEIASIRKVCYTPSLVGVTLTGSGSFRCDLTVVHGTYLHKNLSQSFTHDHLLRTKVQGYQSSHPSSGCSMGNFLHLLVRFQMRNLVTMVSERESVLGRFQY